MPNDHARSSREALKRFRDSVDFDAFREPEDTGVHVHVAANVPQDAPTGIMGKVKLLAIAIGTGLGTGLVASLLQHCGAH